LDLKKVLILGATGMLGSACVKVLATHPDLEVIGTSRIFDPKFVEFDASKDDISRLLNQTKPNWIINCIGIIKPYINENEPNSVAIAKNINSDFPRVLEKISSELGARVIQIATDCVFSGDSGLYSESDPHDATDVYGKTKSQGEASGPNFMNIRCSIIGPEVGRSTSLLEWFKNQPADAALNGFTDHLWNGITTYHFARLCAGIINSDEFMPGVHHFIPGDIVSKANLLHIFAEVYNRPDITISDIKSQKSINRTLQTKNSELNSKLWKMAGYVTAPSVREMVIEQAKQI
jgi:dTDP-4-dehydrorhamnose reductase